DDVPDRRESITQKLLHPRYIHPPELGDLLFQLRRQFARHGRGHAKPMRLLKDMFSAVVVSMIGDQQRSLHNDPLDARFLHYLPDRTVLDGLARIKLSFRKVPKTAAQHKEIFVLAISDQPAAGLDQHEFLPDSLPQLLEVVMDKDTGMHLGLPHLMDH